MRPSEKYAQKILDSWSDWDGQAQMDAQCEQDHRAYDGTMLLHLEETIEKAVSEFLIEDDSPARSSAIKLAAFVCRLHGMDESALARAVADEGMRLVHDLKKHARI